MILFKYKLSSTFLFRHFVSEFILCYFNSKRIHLELQELFFLLFKIYYCLAQITYFWLVDKEEWPANGDFFHRYVIFKQSLRKDI